MFWAPKIASEAISQHQIPKNVPVGACPQTPLASADTLTLPLSGICTDMADQCSFASAGPVLAL